MKQIIAIVKPFLAEKVLESLRLAPLEAIHVREVKGFGRQKNSLDRYGDSEFSMAFLPKVEISMWVDDQRAEEIVRKIEKVARTGRIGDGKIMVLPGMEAVVPDLMQEDRSANGSNAANTAKTKSNKKAKNS